MVRMELTRRERYRQQTIDEITALARAQVAEGGEAGVSLNAIARSLGTSPAALYRYFGNRDELVAELVVEAYLDLAAHLEAAGGDGALAVARAYRGWAVASPNTYRLVFETTSGSGLALAAERIRGAAQRSMDVVLRALADAGVTAEVDDDALAAQLVVWGERSAHADLPAGVLRQGLSLWARLHGLVSLEIGQHLSATGVDPALLFEAELADLVGER